MTEKIITPHIVYHIVQKLKIMDGDLVLKIVTDNFIAIENDIKAWSRLSSYKIEKIEPIDKKLVFHIKNFSKKNWKKNQLKNLP